MFSNVRQRYQVMQDHSKIKRCSFEWSKEPNKRFLVVFWSLVCWIDLLLHIVIVLNVFQLWATLPGCEGSFKDHKNAFWMIQRAKKEVFGHFLEFGLLDRLDIAYCDRTKCFTTFGNVTRSWRIIQRSQKCIFEWSKGQKRGFWPFSGYCFSQVLLRLVCLKPFLLVHCLLVQF